MAIAKDEVQVAVIVVIKKFQAPAAHQVCSGANARGNSDISKTLVFVVVIERIHFLVNVGNEQIDPPVLIVVGRIHTHA